jgi:translation initiation factor 2 subunit 2
MEYKDLLKKVYANLPERKESSERFEIPKVQGHIQGNKTMVNNFAQIASTLGRDQQHFLKYLQRELATPGQIEGQRLIFGRKISSSLINSKIEQYVKDAVICQECKKPDTQLMKEEKVTIIKCNACGARHPLKIKT